MWCGTLSSIVARTRPSGDVTSTRTVHPFGTGAPPFVPTVASTRSVPVVLSSSRPASMRTSSMCTGACARRCTSRCSPAIHHWSWSSTWLWAEYLLTMMTTELSPSCSRSVTSYSLASLLSVP